MQSPGPTFMISTWIHPSKRTSTALLEYVCRVYQLYYLHIPDLILKLYVEKELFPLLPTKWFPFHRRATLRTKSNEYNFLKFVDIIKFRNVIL
jgi:hypothetical protein